MRAPTISPLGDSAVLVEFDAAPDAALSASVHGFDAAVKVRAWPFVLDLVPALRSVCIHYDPLRLRRSERTPGDWFAELGALDYAPAARTGARLRRVPICYAADLGLDLADVAQCLGLTVDALIGRQLAPVYRVAMIGFAPGFPYLVGLPPGLHLPRRATPRSRVPAGSLAIAADLCGIYPADLPGGWHVLGRTPLTLFDAERDAPSLLQAGDQVRFERIDRARFEALRRC